MKKDKTLKIHGTLDAVLGIAATYRPPSKANKKPRKKAVKKAAPKKKG